MKGRAYKWHLFKKGNIDIYGVGLYSEKGGGGNTFSTLWYLTYSTQEPYKNVNFITLKKCNYFDVNEFSYDEKQHLKLEIITKPLKPVLRN